MVALAQAGFRVITPDLPGFGKTDGQFFGTSVEALSDHLAAFARALGLTDAAWIGHSIGCQAVLQLAAQHPALVRALVLAGPTGGYGKRRLHQAGALAYHAVREPWRLLKAVLRDYMRLSPFTYIGTWLKAAEHDPLVHASRVKRPALILVGSKDRVPGKQFIKMLALMLGDVKVVELEGGQHGLPIDAKAAFEAAVIGFLESVGV
jgi:2-hydroxy-6-oxonona-2,4-dienedioate hydrolase